MACFASAAALLRSSNEELVHEPISPALTFSGHEFLVTSSLKAEVGVARSGVEGPFMNGSSFERSMLMTRSYSAPGSAKKLCFQCEASSLRYVRLVASRYAAVASVYGKIEVVAPVSAPMLQMVAIPVDERE